MTIDLRKIKAYLTPKTIALGLGALAVLAVFSLAALSIVLRPNETIAQFVPTETATLLPPTPTQRPTPKPTFAPPVPTPLSIHHVSWTNRETGIYLRDAPGDALILGAIPNGEEVSGLGAQTTYGGVEWVEASYLGQSGWIATLYLFQIEGDYHRVGEDGRWFFRDMNGAIDMYLWFGTPFQMMQTATDDEGMTWQEIRLPDGSTGWMTVK